MWSVKMDAALGIFPIIIVLYYIAIPVGLIVVISYFYKLFKIRNEELKKQNELLNRIVNVLERS
jgi:hypothetical protein